MNAPLLAAEQMDGADLHRQVLTSLEEMDALTPEWNELLTQYAGRNLSHPRLEPCLVAGFW